jgi:hypothetical protein
VSVLTPENYSIIHQFCSAHKQFTLLSPEEQNQFIQVSIATGEKVARTVKQDYNDIPLPSLLDRLGIKIEYDDRNQQIGNMAIRAKYSGNPPTITIYQKTIQQIAATRNINLSLEQLEEIALVHELYHHISLRKIQNPKSQIPNMEMRKKVPRLFDELAAQSFVHDLLNMKSFEVLLNLSIDNR